MKKTKERKHMMISKINGKVHVTVSDFSSSPTHGWRNYYKITPSTMGRLEKLMNSREFRVSATMKGKGTLVSVVR